MAGGADGRDPSTAERYGAWDTHFADPETIDVSFLIVGSTRTDNGDLLIKIHFLNREQ